MPDGDIRERARALLDSALARISGWPDGSPLLRALHTGLERLDRPLRVALAGRIKAGKSTLMNALLGRELVAVGDVVTTFNVNWLTFGERPELCVHFKPETGRLPQRRPLSDLENLTRRGGSDAGLLDSIRYIQVRYPHDLLRQFELIDTPGLASVYETDTAHTREFLAMRGREMTEVTRSESSGADAILYLFRTSLSADDGSSLAELQDPALAHAKSFNTVGVFSMADTFWPAEPDPLANARRIIQRLKERHPGIQQQFHAVIPVAGLAALGAQLLGAEECNTLKQLAHLPPERLRYLLGEHRRFCERVYADVTVAPDQRLVVWDRLGRWGVWRGCELVRQGAREPTTLTEGLLEASGVSELLRLIRGHFGRRAALIQVHRTCHEVIRACFPEKQANTARSELAACIAGEFEELLMREHAFDELRLLQMLHEDALLLSDEEMRQALGVLGECGDSDAQKLGLDATASAAELRAVAEERLRYWQMQSNDALGDPAYRAAARILTVSFARLLTRLA